MIEDVHKTYFAQYLKEINHVSESSVNHYQQALKAISKHLVQKGKLEKSIYEISNIETLESLRDFLYKDPDFIALDKKGHQMYSAGFNHYLEFASGNDLKIVPEKINKMDVAIPVKGKTTDTVQNWERSGIVKEQSLESAGYKCEIDQTHVTFTSKNTGHQYMEGHHALPMKFQDKFSNSLDVYANIVCLCPTCHRLLHYGIVSEKKGSVDKIYYDRADRLANSGIRLSKDEFESLTL